MVGANWFVINANIHKTFTKMSSLQSNKLHIICDDFYLHTMRCTPIVLHLLLKGVYDTPFVLSRFIHGCSI